MKKILLFAILGMFLISFASAGLTSQVDRDYNLKVFCYNDGYCSPVSTCNVTVTSPDNIQIVQNSLMQNQASFHNLTILNTSLTGLGEYQVNGLCIDGTSEQPFDFTFDVSFSGDETNSSSVWITIFLILVFSSLIFLIHRSKNGTNFESMYEKILEKYRERNFIKNMLHSTWYNLLKNSWAMYYSIGFIILMLIFDLTYLFNIESMFRLMKTFLNIYAWGFIVVGMVFLSKFQEFFVDLLDDVQNDNWGIAG